MSRRRRRSRQLGAGRFKAYQRPEEHSGAQLALILAGLFGVGVFGYYAVIRGRS